MTEESKIMEDNTEQTTEKSSEELEAEQLEKWRIERNKKIDETAAIKEQKRQEQAQAVDAFWKKRAAEIDAAREADEEENAEKREKELIAWREERNQHMDEVLGEEKRKQEEQAQAVDAFWKKRAAEIDAAREADEELQKKISQKKNNESRQGVIKLLDALAELPPTPERKAAKEAIVQSYRADHPKTTQKNKSADKDRQGLVNLLDTLNEQAPTPARKAAKEAAVKAYRKRNPKRSGR